MKSSRLVCISLSISAKVLLYLSLWAKREGLVIQNTSPVSAHTIFVIVLRTATSMRSIWSKTNWRNSLSNSYRLTALPKVLPLLYLCSDWYFKKRVQNTRTNDNSLPTAICFRHHLYLNSPNLCLEEWSKVRLETNNVWCISYKNKTTRRFKHC